MLFFTFGHVAEKQITSVKFTYSVRGVTWLLRCRGREYAHVPKKTCIYDNMSIIFAI